ncbi:hypothetical protein BV22DRAFT_1062333 [Leucogyrophana mollusca]|uniref:Uncharacterized protein n=1 Tax=Leucogyrophana mollusca TaxID=85980 RepID=A0ACB8BM77_9AGAM|nr:hypothetical protein BV22DRAFT_1062333 [Leucogyrophana mollusca]
MALRSIVAATILSIPFVEVPQIKERVVGIPSADAAPLWLLALSGVVIAIGFVAAIYDPWNTDSEELDDAQRPADPLGVEPTQPRYQLAHVEAVGPSPITYANDDHKRTRRLSVVLESSVQDREQSEEGCESPLALRKEAIEERAQMLRCEQQSREASARGEIYLAQGLSQLGKEHMKQMYRLNAQASELVFRENNKSCRPGEVDLHGLFVKEATGFANKAIAEARQCGVTQLRLIVGKGLHSCCGGPKIKPALEKLMRDAHFDVEVDPCNTGVLIVHLNDRTLSP